MKTEKIRESILGGKTSLGIELGSTRIKGILVDENNEVIGYEFVSLGKMTDFIKKGMSPDEAYQKAMGHYGRFENAYKYIDPRKE